jgi:hypothetical protein
MRSLRCCFSDSRSCLPGGGGDPDGARLFATLTFARRDLHAIRCAFGKRRKSQKQAEAVQDRPAPRRLLRQGRPGCSGQGVCQTGSEGTLRFRHMVPVTAELPCAVIRAERTKLVGIILISHGTDYVTLIGLNIEGTGDENTVKVNGADDIVENSDITNDSRGES